MSAFTPAAASGRGSSRIAMAPAITPPATSTETVLPSSLSAATRAFSSAVNGVRSAAAFGEPKNSADAFDGPFHAPCRPPHSRWRYWGSQRHQPCCAPGWPGQAGGSIPAPALRQDAGPPPPTGRSRRYPSPSACLPSASRSCRRRRPVTLPSILKHGAALHQQPTTGAGRKRWRRSLPVSR